MNAPTYLLAASALVVTSLAGAAVEPWCGIADVSATGALCDTAAPFVIDQFPGTAWFATEQDGALQIELTRESTVSGMSIAWRRGEERVEAFQVLASVDGESWNYDSGLLESSGESLELEFYPIGTTVARYVRIEALGNHTAMATSIAEVRVHGIENTDAWWNGYQIADLQGEWRDTNWMGWISTRHAPWLWQNEIGWMYTDASSDANMWLWLPGADWAWSSAEAFPCIYSAGTDAWYYLSSMDGVVWYYNYATGEWTKTLI